MWNSQVKTALHGSKGHTRAQKPRERKTVSAVLRFSLPSVWKACEWSSVDHTPITAWHFQNSLLSVRLVFLRTHTSCMTVFMHWFKVLAFTKGNCMQIQVGKCFFSVSNGNYIIQNIILSCFHMISCGFWGWQTFCLACLQLQLCMVCFLQSALWEIIH